MQVFIDGENMRHRLVTVLEYAHLVQGHGDFFSIDVKGLIENALQDMPDRISYFTTHVRQPDFEIPEKLRREIDEIEAGHRHWMDELTRQGIRVVEAGLLKVHENAPCYHCGKRTMVLQEKGVDVRTATEMVMAAVHEGEQTVVVMSSDTDMIPALDVVRRAGTHIVYLCFDEERNDALAEVADETVTYSRQDIIDAFHAAKEVHASN